MGARTQNTRKHTFGIHAEHHMGSPGAECSCRRSQWFLEEEQRAAKRAKLEQMELVVEDSEHQCSRPGAFIFNIAFNIFLLISKYKAPARTDVSWLPLFTIITFS